MYRLAIVSVVFACSATYAQNLLQNPSFDDPPVTSACVPEDWQDVAHWQMTPQADSTGSGDRRNGDFKSPPCPRDGDAAHISLQGWGTSNGEGNKKAWQTVTGLTAGSYYKLSGLWFYGADFLAFGSLTVKAELRTGSDPDGGTVIASTSANIANSTTTMWLPFRACGQLTSGAEITVVVRATYTGLVGWALHADDLALQEVTSCVEPNRLEVVNPTLGLRGNTVTATVTGLDFTRSPISAKLTQPGAADIVATNIQVTSATVMTCKFNLTDAPNGRWNLMVSFGSGDPLTATLPNGFMVVLPALSNGSFELPTASGGCPITPLSGHPTDWLVSYVGTWGDAGYDATTVVRDRVDVVPPSCPPPDGQHYASTYSVPPAPNAQPESWAYQTIQVDNTKTYTVSGYFAGAGNNTVVLDLLDGDEQAAGVPDKAGGLIHDNGPAYDWSFGYVQGKPTGNLMTVIWRVTSRNPGPHVAHADGLRLVVCGGTVTATSMTPVNGNNTGTITGVEVIGSRFSGGSTPKVMLNRSGLVVVSATNVVVQSDTRLTCDLNLTGELTGLRDLIVFKDGCVATLPNVFTVVATSLANGSFELPDPGAPIDCASPTGVLQGLPSGWSAILTSPGSLDRDHNVLRPATCPSAASGHYGSLTVDRDGDLVAYQTLRVTRTAEYTFSGLFAGGTTNAAVIQLIDGTLESGTVLAQTGINGDTAGAAYDWRTRSVSAFAKTNVMTVAWRMTTTGGMPHALHADGLSFSMSGSPCNDPFADVDGDHDVDQLDFGVLQVCLTLGGGAIPTSPADCRCLDHNGDDKIDDRDVQWFVQCGSGPMVPADVTCDN